MKTAAYKLNEFRIIEDENGLLWWEAHQGFGAQRRGMCFMHHGILILGPCHHEEIGYLKGEFLDLIKKLPLWDKTEHYCFASDLLDVASGRSLDQNFLDQMTFSMSIDCSNGAGPVLDLQPGTFRLEKYQITVAADAQVTWQAYGGVNKVLSGHCTIQSRILFIGPEEQEKEKESKRSFFMKLDTLPKWDRTKLWSRSLALRPCESTLRTGKMNTVPRRDTWSDHRYQETFWKGGERILGSVWPSQLRFKAFSWPRLRLPASLKLPKLPWSVRARKELCFLLIIPLMLAGLVLGLILASHSLNEGSHRHHSSEKQHHK
jgi:hypothetical protein